MHSWKNNEGVSCCFLDNSELIVFFILKWLPYKTRTLNEFCYVTCRWRENMCFSCLSQEHLNIIELGMTNPLPVPLTVTLPTFVTRPILMTAHNKCNQEHFQSLLLLLVLLLLLLLPVLLFWVLPA